MFALYIVLGFFAAGAILLTFLYHQKSIKMTSTASGHIVACVEREVRTTEERRDETQITCSYLVAGHEYKIERIISGRKAGRFPVGRSLVVRYNPSVPHMSRIVID